MNIYITKPYTLKDTVDSTCVIFAHGGGACLFSAKACNDHGIDKRWAIVFNTVVIMPEFRNAPEIKQPKGMEDVAASVRFIHENAATHGIDKTKICLLG